MPLLSWVSLIVGLLIGWVTYFITDLFFLRRPKPDPRIPVLEEDVQRCRDDLHAAISGRDTLRADLDAAVSAHKRAEADWQTQLGKAQANLDLVTNARTSAEAELAQRDQKLADVQTQLDRLKDANARIAALQAELDALKTSHTQQTGALQACTQELAGAQATIDSLRGELASSSSQAAATRSLVLPLGFSAPPEVEVYATQCPQHLSDVKGIGGVYEQKLYEGGVGTFWVLANMGDEQLSQLLDIQDFQKVDLGEIRADALRLAHESDSVGRVWNQMPSDDFEPLGGIGPTYEKRLYDAGICTYRALAQATVEQLREICNPPAFRMPDFAAWIAAAKERVKE